VSRLATRWAAGDPKKVRLALLMLLTLRGTPVLYYGDEIGLVDGELSQEDLLDPVGVRYAPYYMGRDPARTPMPWDGAPHGSFTTPDATPWLPMADPAACNVEEQRSDPGSVLTFAHDLLALRRATPALTTGGYRRLPAPDGVWAWCRGDTAVVALNFGDAPVVAEVPGGAHRIAVGTDPARAGTEASGTLALGAWEGIVALAIP
jgi:alpha-glucosidase